MDVLPYGSLNARQKTSPTCIRDSTKLITAPGETATDFSLPASRKPTISTESTKNTVQEFFITAALTYSRSNRNTLFEQSVSENAIVYTRRELPNHNDSWNLSSTLSKGIYDWHLKTSLTLLLSRSSGEQLTRLADSEGNRQSLLQTYRYDYLKAEPKIIWSPADVFEAEYHATLGYGGSKIGSDTRLTPLLDFVQRLHLTFSIGR